MFFQPKVTSKAWSDLESFIGEKYPPCIRNWLIAAGYNKLLALSELNEEKLAMVEGYINKSKELITKVKCCYKDEYKKQTEFRFLPGHKSLILGIREKIKEMKETRDQSIKNMRTPKPKMTRSEVELKSALIENLKTYATELGLPPLVITERNILNFKQNIDIDNKTYTCVFSCPFCTKVTPVHYRTFWMSSNITKHLKIHVNGWKDSNGQLMIEEEIIVEEYAEDLEDSVAE